MNSPTRYSRLIKSTVLVAGATTLAVELSAARLLGAYFGVSNVVWACIIGLILLYLAVGYSVGGRWADKHPQLSTFFGLACWAGLLSGLIPLAAHALLPVLGALMAPLPLLVILAVGLLFIAPITFLGMLSPFALKLEIKALEHTGQATGSIYAYATFGSLLGSLAPVLYLLPVLGTTMTYLLAGSALFVVGFAGLYLTDRRACLKLVWMPVVFGLLFIFLGRT